MEGAQIVERLRSAHAKFFTSVSEFRGETTVVVDRAGIEQVCRFLRDEPDLRFDMLCDLTAVDRYPAEPRFEMVYWLTSVPHSHRLRLKVRVPSSDATMPTVTGIWKGANFPEREVFDMFGIRFAGHPDLRRILLPEGFEGHPLRKDFPLKGYFR